MTKEISLPTDQINKVSDGDAPKDTKRSRPIDSGQLVLCLAGGSLMGGITFNGGTIGAIIGGIIGLYIAYKANQT